MSEPIKARILIVEDERVVAIAIQDRLEHLGVEVVGNVPSGELAIETAARVRPDLALMDIRLQGQMDGVEAARLLRERFRVPSIFLTAYTDDATLLRAKATEPLGYIVKPFDARMLEVTLEVALYRQRAEQERDRAREELQLAQERLRARERELSFVASHLPILMGRVDADLRYRFAAGDTERFFGMPPKSIVGNQVSDVIGLERFQRITPYLERVLAGHRVDFELDIDDFEGAHRILSVTLVPDLGPAGKVVGYHSLSLDITSLKQEEDARQRMEVRYAAILDNSPDAIVSTDEAGRITVFNRGAERIFKYEAREVMGEPLDLLLPPESRDAHRSHLSRFSQEGADWRQMGPHRQVLGRRKDGETFPAEAAVGTTEHGAERLLTAIVRDVTDRKRLEQEYLHAQKMEALGRLSGGVAHDFNNVLSTIMSQVELLKLDLSSADPLVPELDEILKGCDRAAALTRQLLVFSRRQVLKPELVDVNGVLSGMNRMLRRLLGEDIELVVRGADRPVTVMIDRGQLEQVLLNFAVNARDAMPAGGTLFLELGEMEVAAGEANSLGNIEPGLYVVFTIRDTGVGMEPEVRSRAFEPFFTTKEEGKGTGLGLSTVFGIVSSACGHVSLDSAPGKGTRVTVLLPEGRAKASSEAPVDRAIETGQGTVLVVEDDEELCRLTSRILERAGYRVLRARSGDEALRLTESAESPIELLLSDVVMPGMDGYELSQRIRERSPTLETLYMSGYVSNPVLRDTLPPDRVISKPFTASELTAAVRRALDSKRSIETKRNGR